MFALFIPALMGALAAAMGSFIGRAIIALGIGFVTYKGIDLGIGLLKSTVIGGLQGMTGDMVNFVAYMWLDKAITVIFSAIAAAMALRSASGSVKKMEFK